MIVKDIVQYLKQYKAMIAGDVPLEFEYSQPWHFNISYRDQKVPFASNSGVYIYTKPDEKNWHIPIEENIGDIWYIGKSEGDIGGRVWAHMGLIYEPGTQEECRPRFKYHDWSDDQNILDSIRNSIAEGEIVVYTIKVSPEDFNPQVIEKYLLACFYRAKKKLPILNKDI